MFIQPISSILSYCFTSLVKLFIQTHIWQLPNTKGLKIISARSVWPSELIKYFILQIRFI